MIKLHKPLLMALSCILLSSPTYALEDNAPAPQAVLKENVPFAEKFWQGTKKRCSKCWNFTVSHTPKWIRKPVRGCANTMKVIDQKILAANDKADRHIKLIGNVGILMGSYFAARNFYKAINNKGTTDVMMVP